MLWVTGMIDSNTSGKIKYFLMLRWFDSGFKIHRLSQNCSSDINQ
jgi:hypothetical protein